MIKKFGLFLFFSIISLHLSLPSLAVQRFSMAEDATCITSGGVKMPTKIRTLVWRGVEYEPAPNRRAKGWLEWNVAPDGDAGPRPIYGEKVTIQMETNYNNMRYSCFCFPFYKIESGHPTKVDLITQLPFSGQSNPECVVLYWSNRANGLAAIRKEDWANRS